MKKTTTTTKAKTNTKMVQAKVSSALALINDSDANLIRQEIKRIEARDGRATAKAFLDESRPVTSRTHRLFEWDDTVAGEKWRLHQARMFICAVQIKLEPASAPVRAFVNVSVTTENEDEGEEAPLRGYVSIERTLAVPSMQEQVLSYAKRQLLMWRQKFGNYQEFYRVARAIDELKETE